MKLLYVLMACLCTASAYSQASGTEASSDGNYLFSKATVTISNYKTQAVVQTQTFNDTTSLKAMNTLPFPIQPIFLSATIQKGVLTLCKLWNNRSNLSVQGHGHLLIPIKQSGGKSKTTDIFLEPYSLPPDYTLVINGNTATFTFSYPYGNSKYKFPLLGKFKLIMVKDESTKTK